MMNRFYRLAAITSATLALTACGGGSEDSTMAMKAAPPADTASLSPRAVEIGGFATAPVEVTAWRDAWRVPGRLTLDPAATHTLGSIVEGRIGKVLVHPGDRVAAGQVLVTLHSHEMLDATAALSRARAGHAQAESALRLATDAAARAERLYAAKALSLADLERARAEREQAESLRDQAAAELERATEFHGHLVGEGPVPAGVSTHEALVRSPIAGIVVSRDAEPGAVALVGAPLVTVTRLASLSLSLRLPEEAIAAARTGAKVRFTTPAYPDRSFEATVQRVAPAVDPQTRTIEVVARVRNADGALRPEMYVDAEVMSDAGGETLVVPSEAVQLLDGEEVVITAEPRDGGLFIEAVRVRTGRRSIAATEILAGVEAGREVLTRGAATAKAELLRRREAEE